MKFVEKRNRVMGRILVLTSIILSLFFNSCERKLDYKKVQEEELNRNMRFDSIVFDIRLGMSYDDFNRVCKRENSEGVFKQNDAGTAVVLNLNKGFSSPVEFEFFPEFGGRKRYIDKYRVSMRYADFSYYNKNTTIDNLVKESLHFFEKGYKGRDFIRVPNENKLLKYKYIKIDGNRQIVLEPTFSGDRVKIEINDLKSKNQYGS